MISPAADDEWTPSWIVLKPTRNCSLHQKLFCSFRFVNYGSSALGAIPAGLTNGLSLGFLWARHPWQSLR